MKTANVLKVVGIVGVIVGSIAVNKGTKQLKLKQEVKAEGREQAEIATELLDRVRVMNYTEAIDSEKLTELLTDLHFFWNGSHALGLLSPKLVRRVAEFEAMNANLLEDLPVSFAVPTVERHLINAAARLANFLSEQEEAVR